MNDSRIICMSGEFQGNISEAVAAPVMVFIDNATVNNSRVNFSYREDPVFTSVSPQRVIPA